MASPAVPAAVTALLCATCDASLSALAPYYSCADCDSDVTPACAPCCLQLHAPKRSRRHQLRLHQPPHTRTLSHPSGECEEPATEGHGFCDECMRRRNDDGGSLSLPQLAVLSCEGCGADSGLCMTCDQSVHQSIDADEHTRVFFSSDHAADSDAAPLQYSPFTLAGAELRIAHRDAMASYAGRIWPGSMMLARYCEQRQREQPGWLKGKRILELGCGCAAIPSLACWMLGAADLLCTDMNTDGLTILQSNIDDVRRQVQQRRYEAASTSVVATVYSSGFGECTAALAAPPADACSGSISTRRLSFGDDAPDLAEQTWDFILGSYILYDVDSFPALARTLAQLCGPRTQVLLTSHEPTREQALRDALKRQGLGRCMRIPFSLQSSVLSDEASVDAGFIGSGDGADCGSSSEGGGGELGLRSTGILIVQRGL